MSTVSPRIIILSLCFFMIPALHGEDTNGRGLIKIFHEQMEAIKVGGIPELLRVCAQNEGGGTTPAMAAAIIEMFEAANWDIEALREYGEMNSKILFVRVENHLDPILVVWNAEQGAWQWILNPGDEEDLLGRDKVLEFRFAFEAFEKVWTKEKK